MHRATVASATYYEVYRYDVLIECSAHDEAHSVPQLADAE